ncbi:MAG: hypothetical protein SGI72_04205 [Planctomycetota bacterium]|nr:hypothetical protein [Planctomycetota bacterium]
MMQKAMKGILCGAIAVTIAHVAAAQTNPTGQLWVRSDNGAGWSGRCVSLGAQGTQVFTEIEFGQDHAELLSGFDQNPPTPVWSNQTPIDGAYSQVDSAEAADVHVSIHQIILNQSQSTKQTVVAKYHSGSSTPDWTYTFPAITAGNAKVAVSDDGARIVAASYQTLTGKLDLAVFGPGSGTPQWSGTIDNFALGIRGFDLTSDGSLLYLASGTAMTVWSTSTHTNVALFALMTSLDSAHSMSGDGRVIANGGFNFMDVWERNATGSYSKTYTRNIPGSYVCARIDVSGDGSKIAYTFNGFDNNNHVRIECLDVATKTLTMSDEAIGTGTYQNVAADVSMSRDGSRFAVGLWGDQGDVCPELRLYKSNQSAPIALHNFSGSVFDVDMSADGERVAAAVKAVHANTYAGGGSIRYFAFEPQDIRASGVPSPGATVQFELKGHGASTPTTLLWSTSALATPQVFNGIGSLYLNRTAMHLVPAPMTDGNGTSNVSFTLPGGTSQIGQTLYFQGFFSNPRQLTSDWVRLTILP